MNLVPLIVGVVIGMALAFGATAKYVRRYHEAETRRTLAENRLSAAVEYLRSAAPVDAPVQFSEAERRAFRDGSSLTRCIDEIWIADLADGKVEVPDVE